MASDITTEDPPDLAIEALWIAPPGNRAHNQYAYLFFLYSPHLVHQQRITISLYENDTPINWKRNLIVTWLDCSLTDAAFSLVMPFLPLYVGQLGVTDHSTLSMWSGIVFSITFLFSTIASPFWGGFANRKGQKLMLLRSALGMGIVMVLTGLAQNIRQFLILRAFLGLLGGFTPNASALVATQVPRNKSGWALDTLSTDGASGALLGPMAGSLLTDSYDLHPVLLITTSVLILCFFIALLCIREEFQPVSRKEMLHIWEMMTSLRSPKLVLSPFVTTLIIQMATGSIAPVLTLYVRELAGNVSNIAFISDMIIPVPGMATLLSAPRLSKLGDRIGPEKILITALIFSVLLLILMSYVQTPLQPGILRFLLSAADGALLPTIQTLLVYNSSNQITRCIFSHNQSFRDIGNVIGPLMGAAISADCSSRAVFLVAAGVVLFNAVYSWSSLRRRQIPQISNWFFVFHTCESEESTILFPGTSSVQGENRDDHVHNA